MEGDHFTVLDVVLLSLFSALVWLLNFFSNPEKEKRRDLKYHIYPMGGRRFYWRRGMAEKEKNGSFSH